MHLFMFFYSSFLGGYSEGLCGEGTGITAQN